MEERRQPDNPEPVETGVDPSQAGARADQSAELVQVTSAATYAEYPLSLAVDTIGEYGVRGQSAMLLLLASVRRLERDLRDAKDQLARLQAQDDGHRNGLAESERRVAVLTERLAAA